MFFLWRHIKQTTLPWATIRINLTKQTITTSKGKHPNNLGHNPDRCYVTWPLTPCSHDPSFREPNPVHIQKQVLLYSKGISPSKCIKGLQYYCLHTLGRLNIIAQGYILYTSTLKLSRFKREILVSLPLRNSLKIYFQVKHWIPRLVPKHWQPLVLINTEHTSQT